MAGTRKFVFMDPSASGGGLRLNDHVGEVVALVATLDSNGKPVTHAETLATVAESGKATPFQSLYAEATAVLLNADLTAATVYPNTRVYHKALVGQVTAIDPITGDYGSAVIGRLGYAAAKDGQNAPLVLEPLAAADREAAVAAAGAALEAAFTG